MRKRTAARPTRPAPATPATGYWSGAHTLHRLRFHLVWVPKYRKRVLSGPVAARLEALLRQACEVKTWGLHEINVQPDHVHLLLQIAPTDSVMTVMQSLKGGTARVLRAEFPELEEFLWGESFWGDGYFAESVGQAEEAVVRAYITPLKPSQPGPSSWSGPAPAQAEEATPIEPPPPRQAYIQTGTFRLQTLLRPRPQGRGSFMMQGRGQSFVGQWARMARLDGKHLAVFVGDDRRLEAVHQDHVERLGVPGRLFLRIYVKSPKSGFLHPLFICATSRKLTFDIDS